MAEIDYLGDIPDRGYRGPEAAYERAAQAAYAAERPGPVGPSTFGAVLNWAGAFVSLGLVVGMGVWAWQLAMRDVSEVPVVRALEGPMRISPSDPGGTEAPNQGLAVNRIAEGAEAEPVPDQLVLAPPPMDLQDLGVAPAEEEATPETLALIERVLASGSRLAPAPRPSETPLETGVEAAIEVAPIAPIAPDAEVDASAEAVVRILPASVPGVSVSPRPMLRPAALSRGVGTTRAATAPDAIGATDRVEEVAASDLPAGTRLVQLGAFDSAEIARQEWARLAGVFPDFLTGRPRVIEQAASGGQVFYRLRAAGFEDLNASRRFCAALVSRGAACIPVTVR